MGFCANRLTDIIDLVSPPVIRFAPTNKHDKITSSHTQGEDQTISKLVATSIKALINLYLIQFIHSNIWTAK